MKSGYMIQRKSTKHVVAVSKDTFVTIPDVKKGLKFFDEKSAMLFMHFMISSKGINAAEYVIGMEHVLAMPEPAGKSLLSFGRKSK